MMRSPRGIGVVAIVFGIVGLALIGSGAGRPGGHESLPGRPAPASDKTEESYSVGFEAGRDLATNLKEDGVDADKAALIQGFTDGLDGAAKKLTEPQMRRVLTLMHRRVGEEKAKVRCGNDPVYKALSDSNAARSKTAIDQFAARPGAAKLPSGVVYQLVHKGDGAAAAGVASAVVTFHASLLDGQQVAHAVATEVDPAGLLPGAQELLAALHAGDRATAIIPPAAAFGSCGRDPDIGPNEAIMIDVEVVSVKK